MLDDIVTVSDAEVCRSLLELYNAKGIVLEPASGLSVAALELCKDMIAGKNVCCIISGGNNDVARIQDIQRRAQI